MTTQTNRKPLKEQMAGRTRVSFGAAFIRDCKAGVQKDARKVLLFAIAIGAGKAYELKKLKPETVAQKVAAKLNSLPADAELPKNATFAA
jgi:hypothetical protein